jgi:hypothetical protein
MFARGVRQSRRRWDAFEPASKRSNVFNAARIRDG